MKLVLSTVFVLCCGCNYGYFPEQEFLFGEYYSRDGGEHFSHLVLRDDYTYQFDQSVNYSCQIWPHFYGEWEQKRDKVILYRGTGLESLITIFSVTDNSTDVLNIYFGERLLSDIPNLTVCIGLDRKEIEIVDGMIELNKKQYCEENKIHRGLTSRKSDLYKSYPLDLSIRSGQFYHQIEYILGMSEIHIDRNSASMPRKRKRKLLEYTISNEGLVSNSNLDLINDHQMFKEE